VASANESAETNPLNTPWHADGEYERLVFDADDTLIGVMNTPEQAQAVAEAVSAGDIDARREVTRLTTLVGHYRGRNGMTPSERQHYFDESAEQSIQPERWYIDNVESPMKALAQAAKDALADLGRDPATADSDAASTLRDALATYCTAIPRWMDPFPR
jgi:hypothetical protein